jgi:5-methylcytosine-specific restriction endonuclease McrA
LPGNGYNGLRGAGETAPIGWDEDEMMARKTTSPTRTAIKKARSPHQPTGRWCRVDLRLALYLRDGFRCLYCAKDLRDADPRDITLDHIVPKVDGGSNEPSNLVCACKSCNCSRSDLPVERFASPESLAHVRRNTARPIDRYRKLAKAILKGEVGFEETFKEGL